MKNGTMINRSDVNLNLCLGIIKLLKAFCTQRLTSDDQREGKRSDVNQEIFSWIGH